jgi:hypothetical protein
MGEKQDDVFRRGEFQSRKQQLPEAPALDFGTGLSWFLLQQ